MERGRSEEASLEGRRSQITLKVTEIFPSMLGFKINKAGTVREDNLVFQGVAAGLRQTARL